MAKISVLIVDDEPLAHDIILEHMKHIPELTLAKQCYSAKEAEMYLTNNKVDILLLDINMPEMTGLEFLKALSSQPATIITSAYRQYAIEGFDLNVVDYLLKPFGLNRFRQAVNKALFMVGAKAPLANMKEQFFIKVDHKQVAIKLSELLYLEAYGNYVKVRTKQSEYLTASTLTTLANKLFQMGGPFFRVHKSFVINTDLVTAFCTNEIELENNYHVPIGKTFKKAVKEKLSSP